MISSSGLHRFQAEHRCVFPTLNLEMTNEGLSLLTLSPKITLEHAQKSSQCLFWTNRNANRALETAVKVASTQGCSTQAADRVAAKDDTGTSSSSHVDMGYGQETDLEQLDRPPKVLLTSQRQTISSLSQDGIHLAADTPRKDSLHPSPHYTPSQETINRIYRHLQINNNSHLRINHQKGTSATKMRKYLKKELQE